MDPKKFGVAVTYNVGVRRVVSCGIWCGVGCVCVVVRVGRGGRRWGVRAAGPDVWCGS